MTTITAPSQKAIDFVKGYEKCRLSAYMPTANDVPTIGWGSTGEDIKMGMTWTQEQADARFASDANKFALGVARLVSPATTQNQFDAMFCLAYNIGLGPKGFPSSTVLREHNRHNYAGAANAFVSWNKQTNKKTGKLEVVDGLTNRRKAEAEMYRGH